MMMMLHNCLNRFQKMGLRGMTVLVASGDDGIGTGDSRPAPGSTARTDCDKSHPGYPSSSPYVLSIGGTQLTGMIALSNIELYESFVCFIR